MPGISEETADVYERTLKTLALLHEARTTFIFGGARFQHAISEALGSIAEWAKPTWSDMQKRDDE